MDESGGGRAIAVVNFKDMSQELKDASRDQRHAMSNFCEELYLELVSTAETIADELQNHPMLKCTNLRTAIFDRATALLAADENDLFLDAAFHAGTLKHIILYQPKNTNGSICFRCRFHCLTSTRPHPRFSMASNKKCCPTFLNPKTKTVILKRFIAASHSHY